MGRQQVVAVARHVAWLSGAYRFLLARGASPLNPKP